MPRPIKVSLLLLGFDLFIQVGNLLLYIAPEEGPIRTAAFLCRLPLLQFEHFLIALCLGFLCDGIARSRAGTYAAIGIMFMVNGYLVADQVSYKLFYGHTPMDMLDDSVGKSLATLVSASWELDWLFYLNLAALAVITAMLLRTLRTGDRRPIRATGRGGMLCLVLVLVVTALLGPRVEDHGLRHHAIVSLIETTLAARARRTAPPPEVPLMAKLPERQATPKPDPHLAEALQCLRAYGEGRPNVILVVLESVGALQMFREGAISKRVTPNLARLTKQGVLFDTIYDRFPATTRTHVPLQTGGRTITWGRVSDELSYSYRGPNLPRAMKKLGYRTALVATQGLEFENLDTFYGGLPLDLVFDSDKAPKQVRKGNELGGWGVMDETAIPRILDFVDQTVAKAAPFYVEFMTVATHHPYTYPAWYHPPYLGHDREARYYQSLHYTDWVIGRLHEALVRRGLAGRTLFAVTGDHGQAFSHRHFKNWTHRNFLYDENVRTFLLLLAPGSGLSTVVSHRIGGVGDIFPTLLSCLRTTDLKVPGQDLLARGYRPGIQFFHKSTLPELWGLRDGRFKYIARHDGSHPELYDLQVDPREQQNLAGRTSGNTNTGNSAITEVAKRLRRYQAMCERSYVQMNYDFTDHLDGYRFTGGEGITIGEPGHPGPKVAAFGCLRGVDEEFVELSPIAPEERVVAWTRWIPYAEDHEVRYQVRSPPGTLSSLSFTVEAEWDITTVPLEIPIPMEVGKYTIEIRDGPATLLTATFDVASDVEPSCPGEASPPVAGGS